MPADDRESNFERALARHLRAASPDASCLDAEILAAYHERTLSLDEMARCKEHISACARCQESLALVAQTGHLPAEEWERADIFQPVEHIAASPELQLSATFSGGPVAAQPAIRQAVTTPISKGRSHLPWRWIAPLGLAAAAAIVWVGVQEVRTHRLPSLQKDITQVAENRTAAPPPPASPVAPAEDLSNARAFPQPRNPQPSSRAALSAPAPPSSPSAVVNAPAKPTVKLPGPEPNANLAVSSAAETQVVEAPAPVAGYIEKQENADQVARLKSDSDAAKQQRSEKAPASRAESVEVQAQVPPPVASQTVEVQAPAHNKAAATQIASYQNGFGAQLLTLAKVDPHYVVAPGQMQAWRLGNAGLIEHSTDAGKNWKPQASGVTADLTTGSAPSDQVCWLVGKAGTILLTTDGGNHWKSLTSPIAADLGGIHANDAMHASIWDVSNRKSYETSDGGATWTRTANE